MTTRLAACLLAGLLVPSPMVRAQVSPDGLLLVLPFDNPTHKPCLTWIHEGAAILLSDLLAGAGDMVISREERLQAFDRLQLPAGATLSRASTITVGHAVTASLVVSGAVRMQGEQLIARARVVRLESERLVPELEASGRPTAAIEALKIAPWSEETVAAHGGPW